MQIQTKINYDIKTIMEQDLMNKILEVCKELDEMTPDNDVVVLGFGAFDKIKDQIELEPTQFSGSPLNFSSSHVNIQGLVVYPSIKLQSYEYVKLPKSEFESLRKENKI